MTTEKQPTSSRRVFAVGLPKPLGEMTDEEIDAFVDETADSLLDQLTKQDQHSGEPDKFAT